MQSIYERIYICEHEYCVYVHECYIYVYVYVCMYV